MPKAIAVALKEALLADESNNDVHDDHDPNMDEINRTEVVRSFGWSIAHGRSGGESNAICSSVKIHKNDNYTVLFV